MVPPASSETFAPLAFQNDTAVFQQVAIPPGTVFDHDGEFSFIFYDDNAGDNLPPITASYADLRAASAADPLQLALDPQNSANAFFAYIAEVGGATALLWDYRTVTGSPVNAGSDIAFVSVDYPTAAPIGSIFQTSATLDLQTGVLGDWSAPELSAEPEPEDEELAADKLILKTAKEVLQQRLANRRDIQAYTVGGRNIATIPLPDLQELIKSYEAKIEAKEGDLPFVPLWCTRRRVV